MSFQADDCSGVVAGAIATLDPLHKRDELAFVSRLDIWAPPATSGERAARKDTTLYG